MRAEVARSLAVIRSLAFGHSLKFLMRRAGGLEACHHKHLHGTGWSGPHSKKFLEKMVACGPQEPW